MHTAMPPLSALRAFEAAARHLEPHAGSGRIARHAGRAQPSDPRPGGFPRGQAVRTAGAGDRAHRRGQATLSRFADRLRAYPRSGRQSRYRACGAHPGRQHLARSDVEMAGAAAIPFRRRLSPISTCVFRRSSANANFATDGIDIAVRNMPVDPAPDSALEIGETCRHNYIPVCSPRLLEKFGPVKDAQRACAVAVDPRRVARGARRRVRVGTSGSKPPESTMSISARPSLQQRRSCARCRRRRCGRSASHDILAYEDLRTGRLGHPGEGSR